MAPAREAHAILSSMPYTSSWLNKRAASGTRVATDRDQARRGGPQSSTSRTSSSVNPGTRSPWIRRWARPFQKMTAGRGSGRRAPGERHRRAQQQPPTGRLVRQQDRGDVGEADLLQIAGIAGELVPLGVVVRDKDRAHLGGPPKLIGIAQAPHLRFDGGNNTKAPLAQGLRSVEGEILVGEERRAGQSVARSSARSSASIWSRCSSR